MAQLTQSQMEEFLSKPRFATAGTNAADGPPQLTPIWYLYEDGNFYFGMGKNSVKYRNLQRDPRLSLCIDGDHPDTRAVIAYGRAEFMERGTPEAEGLRWRNMRRYYETDEEARAYAQEIADQESVMVKLTPERIVSWDFS